MFGLFKKKSKAELLQERYASLMAESHRLSTTNRALSDAKFAEAETVAKEMDALSQN